MGLRDRLLDLLAKLFAPVPDHPARGGMTGESGGLGDIEDGEDDSADDASGDATPPSVAEPVDDGTGEDEGDGT